MKYDLHMHKSNSSMGRYVVLLDRSCLFSNVAYETVVLAGKVGALHSFDDFD